jgi:NAD(P)-dependent dehydrogenase (short-subunit alcohol dehydrogenase family)
MTSQIAFITGTSSGLGRALAGQLIDRGWEVYGCSRRRSDLAALRQHCADLSQFDAVDSTLGTLLDDVRELDLVVLNAGVLGEIADLSSTPLADVERVMTVNVWANKAIMDWLHRWGRPVSQVIMVSSGASVLGNRGWGPYALSKAALNMLARLYAHEFPDTHITALAPGIIDTAMMQQLCEEADAEHFPALQRLRDARAARTMPRPEAAAEKVLGVLDALRVYPSGSFVDIRAILDPEGFAQLYGSLPGHPPKPR